MKPIKFKFELERVIQAICFLLKLNGGSMSPSSLMALLYLCDRGCLAMMHLTLSGDTYTAWTTCANLDNIRDLLINKEAVGKEIWDKYLKLDSQIMLTMLEDPGDGMLRPIEEKIMREMFKKHFDDLDNMETMIHLCPELASSKVSKPILVEDILRALGKSEEEIQSIAADVEREAELDKLLEAMKIAEEKGEEWVWPEDDSAAYEFVP
jgi:hypothetical protein